MKYIMGVLIFFGVIALVMNYLPTSPAVSPLATQRIEQLSNPTSSQLAVYEPQTLSIPKLDVTAQVESVGLNERRAMDVPSNSINVAWYNLAAKPGEVGNAVIAGHYDKEDGSPAVFYKLSTLEIGDEIKITDENEQELTFRVVDKQIYPYDGLPLNEIFGVYDTARLNLITCEGSWDSVNQRYSDRYVIFSELAS